MNIFLLEYNVTTVGNRILLKRYKDLLLDSKDRKIQFREYNPIEIIIDKIKYFLGLECLYRRAVIVPSQGLWMIESHYGYEREMYPDECDSIEVTKIRLFRWILGLPHLHPSRDIFVRIINNRKTFVSYKETDIQLNRQLTMKFPSDQDPVLIFKDMFLGISDIEELREELISIINMVDPNLKYLASVICTKVNQFGLL